MRLSFGQLETSRSMDSLQSLRLRLTLKGTNIQMPRISINALKLNRNHTRDIQNKQLDNPLLRIGRSSIAKFHSQYQVLARQSCQSRNEVYLHQKRMSSEHESASLLEDARKDTKVGPFICLRNRVNTHIDIQNQIKNSREKSKKCTCSNCEECLKDFRYFLSIVSHDKSLPEISAKSWCIWKRNKSNKFAYYFGRRIHKTREIASLTKMVTAMTAIDLLRLYELDPNLVTYQIRKSSTLIGGTSARLQVGQVYTINELLYGMMLPSGNDAAIAISEAIGLIQSQKLKNRRFNPCAPKWYEQHYKNGGKSLGFQFIALMNDKCSRMGLLDTKLYNSHGNDAYDQLKNVSTCNEIAKVSVEFMQKYEELKTVVNSKTYKVERYDKMWDNTNKLLEDGFEGIKTGINESSGPCLSAYYQDFIVIVLNSKSMNERWIEVKKLVRWIIRKGL